MPTPEDTPPTPAPPPPDPAPAPVTSWWQSFFLKNWKQFTIYAAVFAVSTLLNKYGCTPEPVPVPDPPLPVWQGAMGWHEPTEKEKAVALATPGVYQFSQTEAGQWEPKGDKDGNAFNWRIAAKGFGRPMPVLDQGSIGSCVGNGWAKAVNYVLAIMAAQKIGPPIDGTVEIPAEVIYGGSRVNANGGRSPLFGDGSNGSWAARFVTETGVCGRGVYGPDDVSKYDVAKCRELGRAGIRGELLEACKKNKVSAALVTSADEIKRGLLQGYIAPICSNVGFAGQSSRDKDGFLKARGMWPHCMCAIAYRADKNAFLIDNSWGPNWVTGPKYPDDQPDGSFWITWEDMERIAKQGDSYLVSAVKGFPRKKLNPDDWTVKATPRPVFGRWDAPFALAP